MELKTLLATQFIWPSIPKVVALLLSELERDEPDLKMVNQLIGTDLALTWRLLQTANAPFFKLCGKVNSVSEALAILGLGHVRAMVAAAASAASYKAVPGINLQQFWAYSLNVAKLSRALAGMARQNQQAAFTCGLIHAVGELAMHMGMPQAVAVLDGEISPLDLKRARLETQSFGFCFAQVGAALATQRHFPQPIVDALEHQCAPFDNEAYEPLAGVIHLATWRARSMEAGLSAKAQSVRFPGSVGEVLGIDIDMVMQQDPIDWSAQTRGRRSS